MMRDKKQGKNMNRYNVKDHGSIRYVLIPQRQSGTGTIHDIASDHYDDELLFEGLERYAVTFAAHYRMSPIYCETLDHARESQAELSDYSSVIIDRDGHEIV